MPSFCRFRVEKRGVNTKLFEDQARLRHGNREGSIKDEILKKIERKDVEPSAAPITPSSDCDVLLQVKQFEALHKLHLLLLDKADGCHLQVHLCLYVA